MLTNIAQYLQPLLSGHLGRPRRCPLDRGFTVLLTCVDRSMFIQNDTKIAYCRFLFDSISTNIYGGDGVGVKKL